MKAICSHLGKKERVSVTCSCLRHVLWARKLTYSFDKVESQAESAFPGYVVMDDSSSLPWRVKQKAPNELGQLLGCEASFRSFLSFPW